MCFARDQDTWSPDTAEGRPCGVNHHNRFLLHRIIAMITNALIESRAAVKIAEPCTLNRSTHPSPSYLW